MGNYQSERQAFYSQFDQYWHDLYGEEYSLLDVKYESNETINKIRQATKRVGSIYQKTLQLLTNLDDDTLIQLGFPKATHEFVRLPSHSLITLLGRMDFVVQDGKIKLLEFNSDTPTFIKETFFINGKVCEYFQCEDPNQDLEELLGKSLNKGIREAWTKDRTPTIVFTSHPDHEEDYFTTLYLQKLSKVPSQYVPLSDLQIIEEDFINGGQMVLESGVYTPEGERIDILYRPTYPVEHLVEDVAKGSQDKIGETLLRFVKDNKLILLNPPSAFLLQSKAVQAIIWGLYEEEHPYFTEEEQEWIGEHFLATYLEPDSFVQSNQKHVGKPAFGREGDTVVIYNGDGRKIAEDRQKTYRDSLQVFQEYISLPTHTIQTEKGKQLAHIMYGCFYVHHLPMAIGIRAGGQITDNHSYHLPIGIYELKGEN
ncbi:hypothetical protein Q73_10625 [Bacillus coahuilensis m2-6]|uniref:glutathionylspermidine synthase family protein n=1 Tax=Bacillus coahuilensis TaxID=408580 RepID=UPI00079391DA|nr:glutathionylspermidine synthase family protein [Bacillus coahuilensis]KUP06784.1 hypothetical protein Q73_10625 [Bacillus coahuilensis m2-6]